jgi:hypothetical protein
MLLVEGVVGGAVGGAALSLAFRDWRTGATLALGGAVGFGIGGGVVDLLKQLFFPCLPERRVTLSGGSADSWSSREPSVEHR